MGNASFKKVLWITVIWIIVAVTDFIHSYGLMVNMGCPLPSERFLSLLFTNILSGLLAGLIGGSVIVYYFNHWLRNRSYGEALLRILLSFSILFFGISTVSAFYLNSRELGLPIWRREVIDEVFAFFEGYDTLNAYLFWLLVVLATTITLLVSEKYGPGVFRDFLLGRYFRPRREERIFMFLDLRGSTALAEQLGEEKFFRLIQDLFRDATPAILQHRGQIYQYVGDEIIVSWPVAEGFHQGRCVESFLAIQRMLKERSAYYKKTYGEQPAFKAGLHYGYVMAGEVGVVKREIAFSGDVLNTAARIQSKCNELGVDVLLSESLVHALPAKVQAATRVLGAFPLRGKTDEVVVYTMAY